MKSKHFSNKALTIYVYNILVNKNTTQGRNTSMSISNNDREFIARRIRSEYTEKEHSELDELKEFDKKVKRAPRIFSYIFGAVGAIVMGSGMSLVMTDIAEKLGVTGSVTVPGIIIGSLGIIMAAVNYPIYSTILAARRKKYAPEIIRLSESIMND